MIIFLSNQVSLTIRQISVSFKTYRCRQVRRILKGFFRNYQTQKDLNSNKK
jgi:hypothetical protein